MKKMMTRLAVALAALTVAAPLAHAEDWPARPIKLIAPFAPASTPDTLARIVAEGLRERLGQTVVVENKPGAGGMLGTDTVAKAAPDGYTLGVSVAGPLITNTMLYKKMAYDPARDLTLITEAVNQPSLLVARSELGARDLASLVADLKRRPGKANYASIGNGSLSHLTMELVAARSGTQIVHVPYPGSSQAVAAMLAGDVDMACLPALAVLPQVKAGKLTVIGVSTAKRSPLLPSVPTLAEQGLENVDAGAWIGVIGPAGLAPSVVDRLNREIVAVLRNPQTAKLLEQQMMEPVGSSPQVFASRVRQEGERWKPVIQANRISLD